MAGDDLTAIAASDLARMIRERAVSASEAVDAHLRRIEADNPRLNAIVQLDADGARAAARAADEALASRRAVGPLHGVPFTVKDWIETEGLVCAAGIETRRDFRPKRDATAVARVRAAGGVLLGKTNVTDGAPLYARPNNPHDVARTPGGSSSGDAVAVAAAMSAFGICSDSGGSIRLPAAWCGVPAIKPSQGRVPRTGHVPRIGEMSDPRTEIGVIARSARDLHPLLAVIQGPDFRDSGIAPVPLGDPRDVRIDGLRVARYDEMPGALASASSVAACDAAAAALADAGAIVERSAPPRLDETLEITRAYWSRTSSMAWSEWTPPPGHAHPMTAGEVERHIFAWERLRRSFIAWMQAYDLVLCPAASGVAPPHRALGERDYLWTLPWSLAGYPVAVVPAGPPHEGMPAAVQLVARPWRDDVAIAAAIAIEAAGARP